MRVDDAHIEYGKKGRSKMSDDEAAELKAINAEIASNLAENIRKAKEKRAKRESQQE